MVKTGYVEFPGNDFRTPALLRRCKRGKESNIRSVMRLGTDQRNISADVVVAGQNFSDDPNVLVFIIVAGLIGLVLLMPIGGELGKRNQATSED